MGKLGCPAKEAAKSSYTPKSVSKAAARTVYHALEPYKLLVDNIEETLSTAVDVLWARRQGVSAGRCEVAAKTENFLTLVSWVLRRTALVGLAGRCAEVEGDQTGEDCSVLREEGEHLS